MVCAGFEKHPIMLIDVDQASTVAWMKGEEGCVCNGDLW